MTVGAKPRIAWPDAARGISILLVVLLHSTMWTGYLGDEPAALVWINDVAASLRMPVFFLVAGMFAGKWMDRPWRDLVSNKLALLIWVFLAWQPIYFAFKFAAAHTLPGQEDTSLAAHLVRMVASPVRPNGETWFLWALVVYFMAAKLLRRVPVALHLTTAAVASIVVLGVIRPWLGADLVRLAGTGLVNVVPLYFFFAAGLLLRSQIMATGSRLGAVPALLVVAVWIAAASGAAMLGIDREFGVEFMLKTLGAAAGLALGVLLQRVTPLVALGKRTLEVYVAHVPLIAIAIMAVSVSGWSLGGFLPYLPLVLAAGAIWGALLLHRALKGTPGRYLYEQPTWFLRQRESITR